MTSFVKLARHDREVREAAAEREAEEARKALKRQVRELIPKAAMAKVPKRPRGRAAVGGLSRKEVLALRDQAATFLADDEGRAALRARVQHTALVILLIDGVFGTEPWRAQGPHGAAIAANARMRYLENAQRILDDLHRSQGGSKDKLLAGVLDADIVEKK